MLDFHFTVIADIDRIMTVIDEFKEKYMADFTRLIEAVQRIEDRGDAAIALLHGLAEQLRQAAADPAEIARLADLIDAQASELNQAIVDNTPPTPPSP